jgi:Leucine-rich repeat (LRR) protein
MFLLVPARLRNEHRDLITPSATVTTSVVPELPVTYHSDPANVRAQQPKNLSAAPTLCCQSLILYPPLRTPSSSISYQFPDTSNTPAKVVVIHLRSNGITNLPADAFTHLRGLWTISLSKNAITSVPAHTFDGLEQLEYLSLWSNRIPSLPRYIFKDLKLLRSLYLDSNWIVRGVMRACAHVRVDVRGGVLNFIVGELL